MRKLEGYTKFEIIARLFFVFSLLVFTGFVVLVIHVINSYRPAPSPEIFPEPTAVAAAEESTPSAYLQGTPDPTNKSWYCYNAGLPLPHKYLKKEDSKKAQNEHLCFKEEMK